ncbi:RHS repeat-associated core domain protein [Leptospira interrogans str. 2002000623]|uniref:RHS repeat-associated core domain protein n=4 Tax=Leptospira interrogans TaxID=173 RepID=A0A829D6E8_LEPIR|nr:RHS repeat-associated core domain protein [Leptospira interrogans str. 2002000624]EKQ35953.1 RHS repeat-associated core domain protein [Leptospira interrogans str. 2002000621]EKQ46807.1 RHS repeat-associated core domain protein [Leptospira interrogans str. 2002000623]EMY04545.1 RHS repeat-associated core domain protein [Leptospira interrogans str. 2002000626]EMY26639.1 RHS repeat-associated core domain protein [Leptospira interrogans serovar Australis str. 200703203]OOB97232.1 RHS repeat-as
MGSYWYDESGFRIRKSSLEPKNNVFSNVEILYPSKFFGLEFIESENVISSVNNVYLNGVRIAALNEAGALAYYLTDQVDSVSTVLDDEGNTLSQMQYLPYGETFVQRGDLNFSPKFNSQELDRESGFYFFNARFYDPGIARFTSADTIIDGELDTQGWNRFSYVKGNPIGAKDPTGHEANGGIGIMMNSQCKGNASCNSAGLNAVSEGAKKAVVGTAVVGATAATGYAAAAEVGSAALPSAIYLSSRLGSSNITNSLLNRLPQSQSAVANSVNATKEGLKKANGVGNIGNNPGNSCQCTPVNSGNFRPNRLLPNNKNGVPLPDVNLPHTQIGYQKGRKGDYTQAREWNYNDKGKLEAKRLIDFTDHGRPANHANPHQHKFLPNPTGGTAKHGPSEPLN